MIAPPPPCLKSGIRFPRLKNIKGANGKVSTVFSLPPKLTLFRTKIANKSYPLGRQLQRRPTKNYKCLMGTPPPPLHLPPPPGTDLCPSGVHSKRGFTIWHLLSLNILTYIPWLMYSSNCRPTFGANLYKLEEDNLPLTRSWILR